MSFYAILRTDEPMCVSSDIKVLSMHISEQSARERLDKYANEYLKTLGDESVESCWDNDKKTLTLTQASGWLGFGATGVKFWIRSNSE